MTSIGIYILLISSPILVCKHNFSETCCFPTIEWWQCLYFLVAWKWNNLFELKDIVVRGEKLIVPTNHLLQRLKTRLFPWIHKYFVLLAHMETMCYKHCFYPLCLKSKTLLHVSFFMASYIHLHIIFNYTF